MVELDGGVGLGRDFYTLLIFLCMDKLYGYTYTYFIRNVNV